MFSGRGGSRNYHIILEGRGPSLTDALVVFYMYLLFTEFLQLTIPSELRGKFPRRECGGVQDFRRCGVGIGRGGRHTYS